MQGALQQTPSTQNPDWHWLALWQGRPLPISPHEPPLQVFGWTHSDDEPQQSAQPLPSGRQVNGAQESAAPVGGAAPTPSQWASAVKRIAALVAGGGAAHRGGVVDSAVAVAVARAVGSAALRRLLVARAVNGRVAARDGDAGADVVGEIAGVAGVAARAVAADAVRAGVGDAVVVGRAGFTLLVAAGRACNVPAVVLAAADAVGAAGVPGRAAPRRRAGQLRQREIVASSQRRDSGEQRRQQPHDTRETRRARPR